MHGITTYAPKTLAMLVSPHEVETMLYTRENKLSYVKDKCYVPLKYEAQQMVTTTEQFRGLHPSRRGCVYPDERALDLFRPYRRSSCMLECAWRRARTRCNCAPWFLMGSVLFGSDNNHLCDAFSLQCFDGAVDAVLSGEEEEEEGVACSDACPHDCEVVTYAMKVDYPVESSMRLCVAANRRFGDLEAQADPWDQTGQ